MGRARAIERSDLRSLTLPRTLIVSSVRLDHVAPGISSPVVFWSWNIGALLEQLRYHGWEVRQ
jgi:hypothetical protein